MLLLLVPTSFTFCAVILAASAVPQDTFGQDTIKICGQGVLNVDILLHRALTNHQMTRTHLAKARYTQMLRQTLASPTQALLKLA